MGSSGFDDDFDQWPVRAFHTESEAFGEAVRLKAAWQDTVGSMPPEKRAAMLDVLHSRLKEIDPDASTYDEPEYSVKSIVLAGDPTP